MKNYFRMLAILISVISTFHGGETLKSTEHALSDLLPNNIGDWLVNEKDQTYTPDDLFEYINGGAELYISYGFIKIINRVYSKDEHPDIVVDIFDMGNSKNAFGVFVHSREKVEKDFGQGSLTTKGMIMFWKDKYLISILSYPETSDSKSAIQELADAIDKKIPEEGSLPDMISWLPDESLIETSIRYFQHYIWLNSHFFIADENILNIDEKSEAVLAKYGSLDKNYALLIVRYNGQSAALEAFEKFKRNYLPEIGENEIIRLEDEKWSGCRLLGKNLIIVFNCPAKEKAGFLLDDAAKNIFIN